MVAAQRENSTATPCWGPRGYFEHGSKTGDLNPIRKLNSFCMMMEKKWTMRISRLDQGRGGGRVRELELDASIRGIGSVSMVASRFAPARNE